MHDGKGSLDIPNDAVVEVVEPGIVATIKERQFLKKKTTVPLLSAPPRSLKKNFDSEVDPDNQQRFLRSKRHKSTTIAIKDSLQPGQRVLVKPVENLYRDEGASASAHHLVSDSAVSVATFTSKGEVIEGMPETGLDITITHDGFTFKDQINFSLEQFRKFKGDVFPGDIDVSDVKQSTFGDCFLLSTLMSIMRQEGGAVFLNGMMRQEDETTVLRLYHPETQQAHYLRVFNTYLHDSRKQSQVNHDQPWIHMIEKAYAGFAKKPGERAHASFRHMYGSGGFPKFAMSILMGEEGEQHFLKPPQRTSFIDYFSFDECIKLGKFTKENLDSRRDKVTAMRSELQNTPIFQILKRDQNELKLWSEYLIQFDKNRYILLLNKLEGECKPESSKQAFKEWVNAYKLQCPQIIGKACDVILAGLAEMSEDDFAKGKEDLLYKMYNAHREYCQPFSDLIRLYDEQSVVPININTIARFINDLSRLDPAHLVPDSVRECFLDEIKTGKSKLFHGNLGSARYSQEQLDVFADIKQKTSTHVMTVTTPNEFETDQPKGIKPKHAYALLGTEEIDVSGKKIKMIRIRNPWGRHGLVYNWDQADTGNIATVDESAAEFRVELSDFFRYFHSYDTCPNSFLRPKLEAVADLSTDESRPTSPSRR